MALPIARSLRSASDRITRYILSRNERLFIRIYDRKAGLARPPHSRRPTPEGSTRRRGGLSMTSTARVTAF